MSNKKHQPHPSENLPFPVPGFWRFGWMALQPVLFNTLYKQWGFDDRVSMLAIIKRVKTGDSIARTLLRHCVLWSLIFMPLAAVVVSLGLSTSLEDIRWRSMLASMTIGLTGWLIVSWYDIRGAIRSAMLLYVVSAAGLSVAPIGAPDIYASKATAICFLISCVLLQLILFRGRWRRSAGHFALRLLRSFSGSFLAALGILVLAYLPLASGLLVLGGVPDIEYLVYFELHTLLIAIDALLVPALGVAFSWLFLALPAGVANKTFGLIVFGVTFPWMIFWPGLWGFLKRTASSGESLGMELLREVMYSKTAVRELGTKVLIDLQCEALEKAANERAFHRVVDFELPFFTLVPEDSLIRVFRSVARDLVVRGRSHNWRREALERARKAMQSIAHRKGPEYRFAQAASTWLDAIEREQKVLGEEVEANPEVPAVFVAGPPLTPDEEEKRPLFKGRGDLIQLIEHDLLSGKRGLIILYGQRRMGKTSLRNWLPLLLGSGTVVVDLDFQEASGSQYRETLHQWIVGEVMRKVSDSSMPPDTARWRDTLRWLKDTEQLLVDRTLLVVIDEVERVEDGIRAGWCSTDILDFLRAAGDSLRRIRFLLLTAYPLYRLGPHWVDRLVSSTSRTITYLDEADARDLITAPVPDFPDIYPDGGLERILHETGRHPYLIQKVCDELCSLLNKRGGARKATENELIEVFDQVVNQADLFDELWRQRTDEERAVLRRIAWIGEMNESSPVARSLVREGYLVPQNEQLKITVPLFRSWILQTQGTE